MGAIASTTKSSATIMVWNYNDVDKKNVTAQVALNITGVNSPKVNVVEYRIDTDNSNAYTLSEKMGSLQSMTNKLVDALEKTGRLQRVDTLHSFNTTNGEITVNISLPEQGVSLLKLSMRSK